MHVFRVENRRYAQFERLRAQRGLVHAFSTRPHDVSAREDGRSEERTANRAQMARDLGLDAARLHHTRQVHRPGIVFVDGEDAGRVHVETDALATSAVGTALMTFSADCPLVLLYDPRRRVLGMVHASWRCLVARATYLLVTALREQYGCDPADLLAGIGPSAGPERYEVKEDVVEAARGLEAFDTLFHHRDGRIYFDLWQSNLVQLVAAGVREESIETTGVCTMTEEELFYSFRREKAGCGHFGLMAAMI